MEGMTTSSTQIRKSQTGEPTTNGGHFGSVKHSEPEVALDGLVRQSSIERIVSVADQALASWPGNETLNPQERLTAALADLSRWSAWAVKRRELNTPGVNYQQKESDIIYAWQVGIGEAAGDLAEAYPAEAYSPSEVGADASEGQVTLPRVNSNSPHIGYRDGLLRAHEQLSRWNLRRRVQKLDMHALPDAMADLILWSKANDVDFDQAFKDALDRTDEELA